jgi:hypothetical protein
LKIQRRIDAAVDAYFHSMALDPAPRHARDEPIALGWTTEIIERRRRYRQDASSRLVS